ncbi:hypothetical protein ACTFIW_000019 [Dictyostelium discoideum]
MEAMSGLPTTHSFAFYPGEDELIQFEEGFYNTDLPNLEISNLVPDDSSTVPRHHRHMFPQVLGTFQEVLTKQSVESIPIQIQQRWKLGIIQLSNLISSYTRFRNFCTLNSLNPANITLVVFMDYLTHLFKHKPPLAFSNINGHRSMLNHLLLLKNQTNIVNYPFITRIMTGIHKLLPSSTKYQEIWDANQIFKYLPSLDDTNSHVCPVHHLATYLRASKGRRKPHSCDYVFIQNEGKPLDVKEINIIVLSTLSSSCIDISKFKSHSTLDTFYDKRIIGEKSGGFLNTVV